MRVTCLLVLAACGGTPSDEAAVDAAAPFVLDVHTALSDDGALALLTNLPARVDECVAGPCDDVDGDGLTDAWEDIALDRLRPVQRLDEAESLVTDGSAVLGDIGRVAPVEGGAIVFIVLAYSKDYGSCGLSGHDGDPERVVLHVVGKDGGGPGDVVVASAYTAAHENTATDHGRTFTGAGLTELVHDPVAPGDEPRWVVFPSRDKHATYATIDICENVSVIPCFDEDCAPDGVDDPAAFDRLPPIVNAGEDDARRVEDLTTLGFPGDDAWADQPFCGGQGGTSCSAKVRDKLTEDPFGLL